MGRSSDDDGDDDDDHEAEEEAVGASNYHAPPSQSSSQRKQRSPSPAARSVSPAASMGSQSDALPVPLRGFLVTTRESHPNYYIIGEAQNPLVPFNLDQLRTLQGELAQIGTQANQTQIQLEKEKAELEKWLRQFKSYSGSALSDFDFDESVDSTVSSPTAAKAEERGTRIRTATPAMREHLDQLKKKQRTDSDFDYSDADKKRRGSIDDHGSTIAEEDAPLLARMKKQDTAGDLAAGEHSPDKRKKKKNDIKNRRRGGKGTSGKSVSGKSVAQDPDSKEGSAVHEIVPEEEDTSIKPKIPNQISFESFSKFLDPYVRSLTEEDLALLEVLGDDPFPFMVPRLGKRFSEMWNQSLQASESSHNPSSPSPYFTPGDAPIYGATWKSEDPWCRPVTQRILSALIEERVVDHPPPKQVEHGDSARTMVLPSDDYERLEERLKSELRHLGLIGEEELSDQEREDDEISFQLRFLQDALRRQISLNDKRKAKVLECAKAFMAFQEYEQLVGDVHKQIEKIHLNRLQKPGKKGKKKERLRPVPEGSAKLLKDSDRLLKKLEKVFPREKYQPPTEPVFTGAESEPNEKPFDVLDSLHYLGYPPPENHYSRKPKPGTSATVAVEPSLVPLSSSTGVPVKMEVD